VLVAATASLSFDISTLGCGISNPLHREMGEVAESRVRRDEVRRQRSGVMYIGIGTVVLVLAIVLIVMLLRGRTV